MNTDGLSKEKVSDSQITSEQILQDAFQLKDEPLNRPKQSIQDLDELRSFQLTKRKEYEQQLNKNRLNFGQWLRYAKWEVKHNHDFPRARSIFERALEVNVQHIPFWTHYIQFELSYKNITHARNLLDRAVTTLPRVDKLWFLYVQTEETLKNYQMVRIIFERWLSWNPNPSAWDAYINYEKRYEEYDNAREIYVRYVQIHSSGEIWLKWIDFEMNDVPIDPEQVKRIRNVFELSVDTMLASEALMGDILLAEIINKWSLWEISVKEYERARAIFQLMLKSDTIQEIITPEQRNQIYLSYTEFEKSYGDKDTIESSIMIKRKLKYEEEVNKAPLDYDSWWSYISILQQEDNNEITRETFERAIKVIPTDAFKSTIWRRYIYIWIKYAFWEEFTVGSIENARNIWNKTLKAIPHKSFTFAKIWISFAQFEIRNDPENGLANARKILGRSIGQSGTLKPKRKLFKFYIELEQKLGEWDRVRKLYEKWLELSLVGENNLSTINTLLAYIDFEKNIQEHQRCISLFELGVRLVEDDKIFTKVNPLEHMLMQFITYYKEEMRYTEARLLYRKLVERVSTPKVWISFALFESSIPTDSQLKAFEESTEEEFEFSIDETHRETTRSVFREANDFFKQNNLKEDRAVIIEAWKQYEEANGSEESLRDITKMLPVIVKRRRLIEGEEEEYLDYIFPEDEETKPAKISGLNAFLANAQKWMANQN